MSRGSKTRLFAFLGTLGLHAAVVGWLAASPERTERLMNALEMDLVEFSAEPEPEPEPLPPPPEAEAEPEPEVEARPRPRREAPEPTPPQPDEVTPSEDDAPPSDEPPAEAPVDGPADQAPGPPVLDFGEQNFAAAGSGASWAMGASNGMSRSGAYRPGVRGGGGGGSGGRASTEAPAFTPVPRAGLSRRARLDTTLARRYPDEARRMEVEGAVRLLVDITSNGAVRNVRVLSDPGGGLGEAALEELSVARFRPALDRQGQPVDTRVVYTVRYVLEA